MPAEPPLHLVFGASGYIGSNLVPELLRTGRRVRASARNVEVLEGRGWSGAELAQADALNPATLPAVLAGVDVAYYLVHSMAAGRDFAAIDRAGRGEFRACRGRRRRATHRLPRRPDSPGSEVAAPAFPRRDRRVAAQLPGPVTEVRAGMIIGPGSAAYEVIRDLVNHLPAMVTPAWVRSRSTPIALPDLLAYLVAVADLPAAAGRILDAGGPDAVTYEEIMRCYGRLVGRQPLIIPVPVLTPRLSSYWLRFVTSVPTNVAQALVEGLEHDFVADDAELRHLVPRQLMGLEEAIREAIDADRRHDATARWVEGAIACRNFHPEYGFYAKRAGATAAGPAAPEHVFRVICRIGGDEGYFFANSLWWIRRALDWLAGGPSFRRSRSAIRPSCASATSSTPGA